LFAPPDRKQLPLNVFFWDKYPVLFRSFLSNLCWTGLSQENDFYVLERVISLLDLAKAVLEEQDFENRMLKSHIKNWPDEPQA